MLCDSNKHQKAFTCESTGHSSYTFFEAMESEVGFTCRTDKVSRKLTKVQMEASKEINSIFPEGLRSRVLHYVQFMNTPRMDDLGKYFLGILPSFVANDDL
jgi:hypothetical protein